jgi:ABC-type polysaccharide/polyol phosphate export permease
MIEPKDILDWCFTLASLDFGVFGFLYSVYAAASFQATPERPVRPPITRYLRRFCQAVVAVLVILTLLAAFTSYSAAVDWQVWLIIFCFLLLTGFSLVLVFRME